MKIDKKLSASGGKLSASGGPLPLRGLCPWTPLGALPPDSRYRLALHALAMARPLPLSQILDPPLFTVVKTVQ